MLTDSLRLRALLHTVVGWVSREQQHTNEYLAEGNHVLKEQLGRRILSQLSTTVTPTGAGP